MFLNTANAQIDTFSTYNTKTNTPKFPTSNSQFQNPNSQFSQLPIRLPLSMSGGFAEIRPNHFHSGIDIRTEGKEGQPVYAPADGYVSRINISAWGGGKVLYITHPDGYRTVYMHLSEFCGKIGQFVHDYQYSHHLYAFDTELPPDSIKVKKGDLVALTGNTGGSMGPHLHYDIRLAENDQAINPLYFGLSYNDPIAPTIAGIKLYPASPNTTINGHNQELKIYPLKRKVSKNSKQSLNQTKDTFSVSGRFYTGIYTYDQMEYGSNSKNGVEKIELFIDGVLFHSYHVPAFLFEETKAINALIDYRHYQRSREYYILSRRLRGDPTNFNSVSSNYGYILFDDNVTHEFKYKVSDFKGNTTSHTFFVRNDSKANSRHDASGSLQTKGEIVTYYKPYILVRKDFVLNIDANNLYENDEIIYRAVDDVAKISQQHCVSLRNNPMPPHKKIDITMTIPDNVPQALHSKLVVVCINGKNTSACPTKILRNKVSATCRNWGGFALRLDTIAPTIRPLDFRDGQTIRNGNLTVVVKDNLSGIESYSCTVNGVWHLLEHDGKSSSLVLDSKKLSPGKNTLVFTITDAVGNTTTQRYTLHKL